MSWVLISPARPCLPRRNKTCFRRAQGDSEVLSACGCLSLAVCPTPSEHSWGGCCLWSAPHDAPGSLSAPLGQPAPTSWVLLLKQVPWLRIMQQTPVQTVHSGEKNQFPHPAATCMGCSKRQQISVSRAVLGETQILISLSSIFKSPALNPRHFPSGAVWLRVHAGCSGPLQPAVVLQGHSGCPLTLQVLGPLARLHGA